MALVDLTRVREYTELGFEKEEALKMVQKEMKSEVKEEPKDAEEDSEKVKELNSKIDELQNRITELETKEPPTIDNEDLPTITETLSKLY